MSGQILVGIGHHIRAISDDDFTLAMERLPNSMASRLAFMSADHHTVRDFVVREMPRQRQPISPRQIAAGTGLGIAEVVRIVSDLEKNLFFLVRNAASNVSWAYPVTAERTAHHLSFSTGEKTFGA
jgi:hypothetical protein